MKSRIIHISAVLIIFLAFLIPNIFPFGNKQPESPLASTENIAIVDGGIFDAKDYREEIAEFSIDLNVDRVTGGEDAVDAAISTWRDIWYYDKLEQGITHPFDPLQGISEIVYEYDEWNDCWLVYGELPAAAAGSVPHILIESDGTVLAAWIG